jgi:DNA-binding MarR family transcriptional regulator
MEKKHIGFLLKLINDRLTNKFNQLLKEKNITAKQLQILEYLKSNQDKPLTQKDLEVAFHVSHPTISKMLKEMEKNAFIHTYFSSENKKMKIIEFDKSKLVEADEHRNSVEKNTYSRLHSRRKKAIIQLLGTRLQKH